MLAQQRKSIIEAMVKEKGSLKVSDLSEEFNVSQETIRRDIDKLQEECTNIVKIHGGVCYVSDNGVPSTVRKNLLVEEKLELAKKSVSLIKNGDIVFFDCSTTSLCIVQELIKSEKKVTIISNSSIVNDYVKGSSLKLIMIGGIYCDDNDSYTGSIAIDLLSKFSANRAFISCPSFNLEKGLYDNSEDEAMIRHLMMKNSKQVILVVDHTKFDSFSLMKISDVDCVDVLITDKKLTDDEQRICSTSNITIL